MEKQSLLIPLVFCAFFNNPVLAEENIPQEKIFPEIKTKFDITQYFNQIRLFHLTEYDLIKKSLEQNVSYFTEDFKRIKENLEYHKKYGPVNMNANYKEVELNWKHKFRKYNHFGKLKFCKDKINLKLDFKKIR